MLIDCNRLRMLGSIDAGADAGSYGAATGRVAIHHNFIEFSDEVWSRTTFTMH